MSTPALPTIVVRYIIRLIFDIDYIPTIVKLELDLVCREWFKIVSSLVDHRFTVTYDHSNTSIHYYTTHLKRPCCVWKNVTRVSGPSRTLTNLPLREADTALMALCTTLRSVSVSRSNADIVVTSYRNVNETGVLFPLDFNVNPLQSEDGAIHYVQPGNRDILVTSLTLRSAYNMFCLRLKDRDQNSPISPILIGLAPSRNISEAWRLVMEQPTLHHVTKVAINHIYAMRPRESQQSTVRSVLELEDILAGLDRLPSCHTLSFEGVLDATQATLFLRFLDGCKYIRRLKLSLGWIGSGCMDSLSISTRIHTLKILALPEGIHALYHNTHTIHSIDTALGVLRHHIPRHLVVNIGIDFPGPSQRDLTILLKSDGVKHLTLHSRRLATVSSATIQVIALSPSITHLELSSFSNAREMDEIIMMIVLRGNRPFEFISLTHFNYDLLSTAPDFLGFLEPYYTIRQQDKMMTRIYTFFGKETSRQRRNGSKMQPESSTSPEMPTWHLGHFGQSGFWSELCPTL
eukprot:gene15400-18264_t